MIKTLRFFVFSVLMMLCGTAFAQTTVTFDWSGITTTNQATAENVYTQDPITLTFSKGDNTYGNWPSENKEGSIRMYTATHLNIKAAAGYQIMSINFTPTSTSYSAAKLTYNGTAISDNWSISTPVSEILLVATANARFKKIEVTYIAEGSQVKTDPAITFSQASVELALGETFTAPTLSKATTADVTYTSSNTDVATVDATTGTVTIVATGTTTITASAPENDTYRAGSASYTITVKNPIYTEVTLPYNESFFADQGSFVIENTSLGEGLTYVWTHSTYSSDGFMKASAFKSAAVAAEAWLISPTINMTNISEATVTFDHTGKFFTNPSTEVTLWIKEETATEWTQLTIPTYFSNEDYTFVNSDEIDITAFAGKKVKIGFKYVSTTEGAGTWEIKNFSVVGVVSGIENVENNDIIEKDSPIYNIAGQVVTKDYKGIVIKNGKKYIQK